MTKAKEKKKNQTDPCVILKRKREMNDSEINPTNKSSISLLTPPRVKERMPEDSGLFFEKLSWKFDEKYVNQPLNLGLLK